MHILIINKILMHIIVISIAALIGIISLICIILWHIIIIIGVTPLIVVIILDRMAFSSLLPLFGLLSLILLHHIDTTSAIRLHIIQKPTSSSAIIPSFREAPAFRNGETCTSHDEDIIHIVMPLDTNYIRGTMAAILSILQHSTCPENVSFHFLTVHFEPEIFSLIKSTFPYLRFKMYQFDPNRVRNKISKSIRQALDQPLNYARIYMSDILPKDVKRVIYLDSDIIVVDDIAKLWKVDLGNNVLAAPEYCHANFTNYFTEAFWSDVNLSKTFEGRRPCYFNTGVMVVDIDQWRRGGFTQKVEEWMAVQKHKRIYHLGSLPPVLLVFAGKIRAVDHRWNQHGLGGDNLEGRCRGLHPGPISLNLSCMKLLAGEIDAWPRHTKDSLVLNFFRSAPFGHKVV